MDDQDKEFLKRSIGIPPAGEPYEVFKAIELGAAVMYRVEAGDQRALVLLSESEGDLIVWHVGGRNKVSQHTAYVEKKLVELARAKRLRGIRAIVKSRHLVPLLQSVGYEVVAEVVRKEV